MKGRVCGGGGCCIASYARRHHDPISAQTYNYNYNPYYDSSKMEHIMLRFRPIAPKPVVGGPTSTTTTTTTPEAAKNDAVLKGKRRSSGRNSASASASTGGFSKRRRRMKSRSPQNNHQKYDDSSNGCKVTLPLLPETPDLSPNKKKNNDEVDQRKCKSVHAMWLCFGSSNQTVVESNAILEGVTDTWMDGNGLGCTDEERKRRLDEDACPGFISDAWNRVWWTNKAYRRMVTGEGEAEGEGEGEEERSVVRVKLGMREKVELPAVKLFPAFTCRVKVEYYSKEGRHQWLTLPCDAWRLDGGGFAWRLDTKAALSLSLSR